MTIGNIALVKYVFLDVVAYTRRTIEAQSYIIGELNRIVKATVLRYKISDDSIIYIPTGDGMCLAVIAGYLPYDIHMSIAKEILRRIWVHNSRVQESWKKFGVRIGVNQCDDNIVTDVNGRRNVAGAGVNNARRIMDLADVRQILVSSTVYEILRQRKAYSGAFGNRLTTRTKHNVVLEAYQLIRANIAGLNVNPPSVFASVPEPEPKLTMLQAYYFAHSIKNREFLLKNRGHGQRNYALAVLLWYLAVDSLGESQSTIVKPYDKHMPETEHGTLDEQFALLKGLPFWVCCDLCDRVINSEIGSRNHKYFEDGYECTILNAAGRKKLKAEYPEICDEFGLNEPSDLE